MTITRLFQSGFELNSLYSEVFGIMNVGNFLLTSTSPKTGTYCIKCGYTSYGYWAFPATNQVRAGIFFRWDSGAIVNSNCRIISFADASLNNLIEIRADGNYNAYLFVNGSQKGNATVIIPNQYYHYGLDVKIDGSAGWANFYLDGALAANFSGNTGTTQIARFTAGASGAVQWDGGIKTSSFDDLTIDDTTGEAAAAKVPIITYKYIAPNGDGNYSGFTGSDGNQVNNSLLVDEIPPNGDTDYVIAGSSGLKDSYALGDYSPSPNSTVAAVIPIAIARKMSAAQIQLKLGTRVSGTDLVGSAQELTTSFGLMKWERQTAKPGGGAWDETAVDGAEFYQESAGSYT